MIIHVCENTADGYVLLVHEDGSLQWYQPVDDTYWTDYHFWLTEEDIATWEGLGFRQWNWYLDDPKLK